MSKKKSRLRGKQLPSEPDQEPGDGGSARAGADRQPDTRGRRASPHPRDPRRADPDPEPPAARLLLRRGMAVPEPRLARSRHTVLLYRDTQGFIASVGSAIEPGRETGGRLRAGPVEPGQPLDLNGRSQDRK